MGNLTADGAGALGFPSAGIVGPVESTHLPTKWMSADGHAPWLVFSGDDCFSLRRRTLLLDG